MKTYTIKKDSKNGHVKAGQEVELTDEMAQIFALKGLISLGNEPKKVVIEEKIEENTTENKEEKVIKSRKTK
jgi:hypothetical protein